MISPVVNVRTPSRAKARGKKRGYPLKSFHIHGTFVVLSYSGGLGLEDFRQLKVRLKPVLLLNKQYSAAKLGRRLKKDIIKTLLSQVGETISSFLSYKIGFRSRSQLTTLVDEEDEEDEEDYEDEEDEEEASPSSSVIAPPVVPSVSLLDARRSSPRMPDKQSSLTSTRAKEPTGRNGRRNLSGPPTWKKTMSLMKKRVANAVHIKISERGIAKQAHTEEKHI